MKWLYGLNLTRSCAAVHCSELALVAGLCARWEIGRGREKEGSFVQQNMSRINGSSRVKAARNPMDT